MPRKRRACALKDQAFEAVHNSALLRHRDIVDRPTREPGYLSTVFLILGDILVT